MHLIMIAALTASQGSTNRHYVRQSMVSDRCVLIPAYRPAFKDLARLVSANQRLSLDMESVRLIVILSDGDEVSDFRQQYPQQSAALTFLALDGLLHRHVHANVTISGLMRQHNSRCWEPRRTMSAIKKFVGLDALHRRGCTYGWVLDSESMPLRKFTFSSIFNEFEANPRVLATNMSHRLVKPDSRHAKLMRCAARGLGLARDVAHHTHRTVDWWVWSLKDVVDLMAHVRSNHRQPFLHGLVSYPAGEAIYYGLYVQYIVPHSASARSPVKHTIVSIPEALIESGLAPKFRINVELSTEIWTCDDHHSPWTSMEKQLILSGPLKWVRGWRFDSLRCKNKNTSSATNLLQVSPSVTWATSNFRDQVGLPFDRA